MAVEDFTTYTEVDPNSRISKTATRVTWAGLTDGEDAYVYADKGVDYFNGDLIHYLTYRYSSKPASAGAYPWALTNVLDDLKGVDDAGGSYLAVKHSGGEQWLYIQEVDSGAIYYSVADLYAISSNTDYYLTVIRDEGVGTYGTLYLYIYSDAARTNLLKLETLALHTSKKDFRYIFPCQTQNWGTSNACSGYSENLDFLGTLLPTVTTEITTDIAPTTATGVGEITSIGNALVTEHGHCWSTSANPTTSDSKTTKGSGSLGMFASAVTGLTAATLYHIRAYATNTNGTSYGDDLTFTTFATNSPTVTTEVCTDLTTTTATGNGTITSTGGALVTEHGHCWSTSVNPTTADSKTTNSFGVVGAFTSAITGLTAGTTYFLRAYATNSNGTGYGNNITLIAGIVSGISSEIAGPIRVFQTAFQYFDAYGQQRSIVGTEVTS